MVRSRSSLIVLYRHSEHFIDPDAPLTDVYSTVIRFKVWQRTKTSKYKTHLTFMYNWLVLFKRLSNLYKKHSVFFLQKRIKLFLVSDLLNQFLLNRRPIFHIILAEMKFRFFFFKVLGFSFIGFTFYNIALDYKKSWATFWSQLFDFKYIRSFLLAFNYLVFFNRLNSTTQLTRQFNSKILFTETIRSFHLLISNKNFYKKNLIKNSTTPWINEKYSDNSVWWTARVCKTFFANCLFFLVDIYKILISIVKLFTEL